jgi:uncharacterized protein involved in response to NO
MSETARKRRISITDLAHEPFRLFFPAGTLAGVVGVSLWPLYFAGIANFYPGITHARIMAFGLFGGFIFGFLGTALPRMLAAERLRMIEVGPLLLLYIAMVVSFASARVFLGDILFLALLVTFVACALPRARKRKDLPPPGFILVGLCFVSAAAGAVLAIVQTHREFDPFWLTLQRLLSYQGFVLLPILGVGPFILPRLFGMQSQHDLPEMRIPQAAWLRKAAVAFGVGVIVFGSFFLEASGWLRTAHWLRFGATLGYVLLEMPFHRAPPTNILGFCVRVALGGVIAGFLAVALWPGYRVGLLHLTLVGGFAVITFVVATRVVFGHSGNLERLRGPNRWLLISVGLMLLGLATRISGDFWPRVLASHYTYGAVLWIAGVFLWSIYVWPKVFVAEDE